MKMLPPYIDKTTSNAERKLFRIFREAIDLDSWYCLHSLGVSRHLSKREGEIDFLFIGPEGIFVIEAKGGRVHRENGLWKFTDRYGRITQKRESPFTQARSALYSLKAELVQKIGPEMHQYVFGYGVALPDISFREESPEWDQDTIFDSRDLNRPFDEFLSQLSGYWHSRQRGGKPLSSKLIKQIVNYVRGDFETIRSVSLDIQESETGILELTSEQYGALDAMEENERTIFSGPAGTGKTLLAIEKARRNNALGIHTLFLCFNRLLGAHLAKIVRAEKLSHIKVDSLHHFFLEVISSAGLNDELVKNHESPKLFSEIYPECFLKAWKSDQVFDELIIDEGQDILTAEYTTAVDAAVRGGFKNGRWSLFMDPETQRDMFVSFDEDVYRELKKQAASYQLTVNCRNTKPIAVQAEVISGYPLGRVKKIEGLPVKYLWYDSTINQSVQISDCINKLLADGIRPDDISILSAKRYQASLAGSGRLRLNAGHYQLGKGKSSAHKNLISCGTVQSYKGLESSVVILTDIEDIDAPDMKTVNYVGYTRARTALYVSIDRRLKKKYQEHFTKIAASEGRK